MDKIKYKIEDCGPLFNAMKHLEEEVLRELRLDFQNLAALVQNEGVELSREDIANSVVLIKKLQSRLSESQQKKLDVWLNHVKARTVIV